MGRRKERRLAAMSNAGRRVKLDLVKELSGDLDGNSAMEEVGGESDSKTQPELPNTGKKQQNPLSLLEQYSDDEMDEGSNKESNLACAEDASVEVGEKKIAILEEVEDVDRVDEQTIKKEEEIKKDGNLSSMDSSQKLEKGNTTEMDSEHTRPAGETDGTPLHATVDEQFNGAVVSSWKMVLHEESNQYYYWNITTGETSWDVPDAFALETGRTSVEKDTDDSDGKTDAGMVTYRTSMPSLIEQEMKLNGSGEEILDDFSDDKELHIGRSPSYETSVLIKYSEENSSSIDLSSQLKELSESLLMRLKNLKGWSSNEDEDLKSKYALETEIRLGDIKALSSHGSSLLPFWQHLEVHLKRLETAVDGLIERQNFSSISGAALESVVGLDNIMGSVSGEKKESSTAGENLAEPIKPNRESLDAAGVTTTVNLPPLGSKSAGNGIGEETEEVSKPDFHCEDVDMDVEMEIEDTNPVASTAELQVSTDVSNLHSTLTAEESTVYSGPPLEGWIPPPPLDNEPFPPPPPPDEPFPPPPPEDAPETSHPLSSHFDSVQAFPYPQQYDVSYPSHGLAYYGQPNTEILSSNLYTLPEGGLVPNYFDASSNLYGMVVSQVEPVAYYGSQNTIPSSALAVSAEVLGSVGEPTPQSLPSVVAGSVGSQVDYSSKAMLKTSPVDAKPCQGSVKSSVDIQTSVAAPEAASVINRSSTSDASTSAVVATSPSTSSRGPPKAARSKKRTVAVGSTLRSNKKVSSLVDKWKAAKEELHEEEEEPDPIEIFERKRQREIEEWKAQQIASGEAKDNANFQPLGGDWRERVKRKRAERMKGAGQSSISTSSAAADGIQQPPDLVELSKALPSGWQAYWDESSKQIYYGNTLTSETTWDRPTAD